MSKLTNLYFIALIPPAEVFEEVLRLKMELFEKFELKAALRSPPHITLHMPFQLPFDKEENLRGLLLEVASSLKPISIVQNGFGHFSSKVIYARVDITSELLQIQKHVLRNIQQKMNIHNADYKNRGFHPHMTIAFRDLKKPLFNEIWPEYTKRSFQAKWESTCLSLLKHGGDKWNVHSHYSFEG